MHLSAAIELQDRVAGDMRHRNDLRGAKLADGPGAWRSASTVAFTDAILSLIMAVTTPPPGLSVADPFHR